MIPKGTCINGRGKEMDGMEGSVKLDRRRVGGLADSGLFPLIFFSSLNDRK